MSPDVLDYQAHLPSTFVGFVALSRASPCEFYSPPIVPELFILLNGGIMLSCYRLIKAEAKILKGPHDDLENYLEAIDQLRSNIQFFGSNKGFKSGDSVVNHANNLIAKAISMLEDEFKQLLSSYSQPVEPERLFDCLPNSMQPSSGSPGPEGDSIGMKPSSNHHFESQNNNIDVVVYTSPALVPPRILPLLHDITKQMVQAGHQQQLAKIYSLRSLCRARYIPCPGRPFKYHTTRRAASQCSDKPIAASGHLDAQKIFENPKILHVKTMAEVALEPCHDITIVAEYYEVDNNPINLKTVAK
ncbi:exocyst complex component EXO70A1-like [Senna tora]|uniref:Exocyst complex component EXO70A1-like n=1 Tax=Senna tora TaxID=362788 RepID=A0A834SY05_9FABA|nr:exocyst complex component EXO70A1-like [Senna tora]